MATLRKSAQEYVETRISELEAEVLSYVDQLAEVTQERDAALVELNRIKAAYPDVV